MPAASEDEIAQMTALLQSGPLVIGEDHTLGHARIAIKRLIDARAVAFLSIESPVGPANMAGVDGRIKPDSIPNYWQGATPMANVHCTSQVLVAHAVDKGVVVYCHDIPLKSSPLNYLNDSANLAAYPNQARQYLPGTHIPDLPQLPGRAARLYRERNVYSANYLKAMLGNGVRVLHKLVILAGADHVDAPKCGAIGTLQANLGIANTRTFVFN
jgi:hypothetical protein